MDHRSYNQFCALAYALDVIGERWTLLIVRELLAGPRRFKDLLDGLPGISTNLLSERLKSLEQQGILTRRVLPPPSGSSVYELTPMGQALEAAVLELSRWGSRLLPVALDKAGMPSIGTATLAIKAFFHPERAKGVNETFELQLGCEVMQVQIQDGRLRIHQGQALRADVIIQTDIRTWMGLFSGKLEPGEALTAGLIRVRGDLSDGGADALCHFLEMCGTPGAG